MIVDSNATMGRFSDNACRSSGDMEIDVENGLVECPFSELKHCSVRLECSIIATIDAEKVLQLEAQVYEAAKNMQWCPRSASFIFSKSRIMWPMIFRIGYKFRER